MLLNKKLFLKYRYLIAPICGILMALPLIYSAMGILQWISLIPTVIILYLLVEDATVKYKKLYLFGLSYFFPFFVVVFHWFYYMHPMDFAGLSGAASFFVVTLACVGMAIFQSFAAAFIFPIFAWISRGIFVRRHQILKPFLLAAMFVIVEWSQTLGWWGVPWGRLALGQLDYSFVVQPASVLGSYFISFVLVLVNAMIAYALLGMQRAKLVSYICIGVVVFQFAFGGVMYYFNSRVDGCETVKMAAAQDTVSNEDKWGEGKTQHEKYRYTIDVYGRLTAEAASEGAVAVVWPETVLPYTFFNNDYMVADMSRLARENNITILFSTFTEAEGGGLYNSIVQVNPDGTFGNTVYAKQHLVPFGEFLPMAGLIEAIAPPLAELAQTDNIVAGEDSVVLETAAGRVGGLICFDSIYEDLAINSVRNGAEVLVVSTNDAWFRESAALSMHYSQSRLRAIECGRYVVRSANTGISAIITSTGKPMDICGAGETGEITEEIYLRENRTVYSYIGDAFVYALITFVAVIIIISIVRFFGVLSKKIKELDKLESNS